MTHDLPLEQRTLHGHFSRDLEPALTVDPEWPIARAHDAWLRFGFDEQLGRAARIAVVDLRVTQAVNGTLGVHAVLADRVLR